MKKDKEGNTFTDRFMQRFINLIDPEKTKTQSEEKIYDNSFTDEV